MRYLRWLAVSATLFFLTASVYLQQLLIHDVAFYLRMLWGSS